MPQDVSPGFSYAESRTVRLGDRNSPGLHPGTFSVVPSGLVVLEPYPGLTYWATLSRPYGTHWERVEVCDGRDKGLWSEQGLDCREHDTDP